MANTVQAGIVIDGVIDGTTVGYQVIVVYGANKPLEQWFNEETGACTPDWAAAWTALQGGGSIDNLPRIYIRARDLSTGADLTKTVTITQVIYNGVAANWNAGGTAHNGLIRMADASSPSYGYTYDNKVVPTVMIIDNPADSLTNPDNDRISFSGTVVTEGGQVDFKDVGKDIDIHPELSANAGYSLQLIVPEDKESYIYDKQISTKRIAVLYYDGNQVDPAAVPHIFEFEDVTGVTDVPLDSEHYGTNIIYSKTLIDGKGVDGNTIEIKPDAVNSMMTMRCNCYSYENGTKGGRIASALSVIYDTSDEFQVKWEIADSSNFTSILETISNQNLSEGPRFSLRKSQTRYLRPKLVKGSGGDEVAATNGWRFNADDPNADAAVTDMDDTRINKGTTGQTYCYIKYTDVVKTVNGTPTRRPVVIHAQTTI